MEHMQKKYQISCTSIHCPERKSLCCKAGSIAALTAEGEFQCSNCFKPFQGGKCTAMDTPTWEDTIFDFLDKSVPILNKYERRSIVNMVTREREAARSEQKEEDARIAEGF